MNGSISAGAVGGQIRSETASIEVGGRVRTYEVVSPDTARGKPAFILLVLHGSNQTGAKVREFSGFTFDQFAARSNAIVLYPDAHKGLWNDARLTMKSPARLEGLDDVAFMTALIDHFQGIYGPMPVFAAGYSNGGQLVVRLIHEIPERLAGAALIGATQPTADNLLMSDRHLPVPVILIHGTRDPLVPYNGGVASLWGFFSRGAGLSATDSGRYFAERNGIMNAPSEEQLPHQLSSGKTSVTVTRWRQSGKKEVTLYTVVNGGHVIPNTIKKAPFFLGRTTHDISAAEVIAELIAQEMSQPTARQKEESLYA